MLTPRGWSAVGAAGALWFLGRLFGVAELGMAAVATLVLVVLAILATRILSNRLEVSRRMHPVHLHADQRADVEVRVVNRGRLPTAALRIADDADPALSGTDRFAVRPLHVGESVALRYQLQGRRRGAFTVGPTRIEARDPAGLARRTALRGPRHEVVVYPPIEALGVGPALAGHIGTGTDGPPRPGPSGDDLANLREYVQGDDLRKVHWRSTAHRGKLMVRQEENRQRPEAVVLLDRRASAHTTGTASSSFELAVSAVASIVWHLSSADLRVLHVDRPLQGQPRPTSFDVTLAHLARVDTDAVDIATLWHQLSNGIAGEGALVAVVPTPDAALLRWMVRAGRGFGARTVIVVESGRRPRRGVEALTADEAAAALRVAGWAATVLREGTTVAACWQDLGRQRPRTPGAMVGT